MDDNKTLIRYIVDCAIRVGEKQQECNPDTEINPLYEGATLILFGMLYTMTEEQLLNVADGMGLQMDIVRQLVRTTRGVPVNSRGGGGVS